MANYNTHPTTFTVTENMTVTFVLDWGVIQVSVADPDVDDFDYIVDTAQFLITDELACAPTRINANKIYLTNSYDETVEV